MRAVIAALFVLATCFAPPALAASAKSKGKQQGSTASQAPQKPKCSPNPERACY
jgi:hypothetical protein